MRNELLLSAMLPICGMAGETYGKEKPEVVKELSRKLSNYLRSVDAQRPLLRATNQPVPWPDEI